MEVEVGEYEKNRRYEVPKGTKYVHVVHRFRYGSNYQEEAQKAIAAAWKRAREEYGHFEHEQVDIMTAYVTCRVIVEFRVREL